MKIEGFPGCCGAAILSQLHAVGGNYNNYDPAIEDGLMAFLKKGTQKGISQAAFVDDRVRTVSIVITVERQKETEALLKKLGGQIVAKFTNVNTDGVNRIWVVPNLPNAKVSRVNSRSD